MNQSADPANPHSRYQTAVLKDDQVDLESIKLTGTKPVDSLPYMLDKLGQLGLVILRNRLACGPPLGLAGHTSEATNSAAAGRTSTTMASTRQ